MILDKYKNCIQWDDQNIKGFFGEYRWLSNFHECKIKFRELDFNCSEAAYMYAKLEVDNNFEQYNSMKDLKPWEVKKWGRSVKLREDWEEIKFTVMRNILYDKFTRNLDLKEKLIATGDKYLEESNNWRDTCWGFDINLKKGENNLGKILMEIRSEIQK